MVEFNMIIMYIAINFILTMPKFAYFSFCSFHQRLNMDLVDVLDLVSPLFLKILNISNYRVCVFEFFFHYEPSNGQLGEVQGN